MIVIRSESEINKDNFFYRHRKEIGEISEKHGVDVGVATSMFANGHNGMYGHKGEYTPAEMNHWMSVMSFYQRGKRNLTQLFG